GMMRSRVRIVPSRSWSHDGPPTSWIVPAKRTLRSSDRMAPATVLPDAIAPRHSSTDELDSANLVCFGESVNDLERDWLVVVRVSSDHRAVRHFAELAVEVDLLCPVLPAF